MADDKERKLPQGFTEEDDDWLRELLVAEHQAQHLDTSKRIYFVCRNGVVQAKQGRAQCGPKFPLQLVKNREGDRIIDLIFSLKSALKVELKLTDEQRAYFFAIADCVAYILQALTMEFLRYPEIKRSAELDNSEYKVCNRAAEDWRIKQAKWQKEAEAARKKEAKAKANKPEAKKTKKKKAAKRVVIDRSRLLLASQVVSTASHGHLKRLNNWYGAHRDRMGKNPPWPTSKSFAIHNKNIRFIAKGEKGRDVSVELAVFAQKDADGNSQETRIECPIVARGSSQWSKLHKIVAAEKRRDAIDKQRKAAARKAKDPSTAQHEIEVVDPGNGDYQIGAARAKYDETSGKWILSIPFTRPRPQRHGGRGEVVAVVPKLNSVVMMFSESGRRMPQLDNAQLLAVKSRFHQRRSDVLTHLMKHAGSGASGRGRKRRFRDVTKIRDLEREFVKTWCQQQGAYIAKLAKERGWGRVLIADMESVPQHTELRIERLMRQFPYALLRDKIVWALMKEGIPYQIGSARVSGCRVCGHEERPMGRDVLVCENCGAEAGNELLRAWSLFDSCDIDVNEDFNKRVQELAALREENDEKKVAAE